MQSPRRLDLTQYAVEHTGDMIFWFDHAGRIVAANEAACQRLGYSQQELQNLTLPDINPESAGRLEVEWADLKSTGSRRTESTFRGKAGEVYASEVSANHVVCGAQEYNCMFVSDITERKRMENEMRLAASVFDSTQEVIIVADSRRKVLRVNKQFTQVTGYTPEEVIGRNAGVFLAGRLDMACYRDIWRSIRCTGYWRGELWNRRKGGDIYPAWVTISAVEDKDKQVVNYVSVSTDIREFKEAEKRIRHLAYYNPLTELPNRNLFRDRAEQAIAHATREATQLALLFVDLDRFKTVNDSLGHMVGDGLLQAVAQRISALVRGADTVGRLGGDEFLLLLADDGESGAARVAEKLVESLALPYEIDNHSLQVTPSIGISIFPKDGGTFDELLKHADIAMYEAKGTGRNAYHFFTPEMNRIVSERVALENALRDAIQREEFIVHCQPQIDLRTGHVVGVEALVRWQHPKLGMVPPTTFIPVAEESNLILQIGEWVLAEACRQARAWQAAGIPPLRVSVNFSPRQFRTGNIPVLLQQVMKTVGLDAPLIEIEITEGTLVEDVDATRCCLNTLKKSGIHVAIDDFGTGYSSLSYLKRFPIDKLKIDRSFVRDLVTDPDDRAIATAIVNLGHSLGLKVTAEGVETSEQLDILRQIDCDEAQGFLFSKPLSADAMFSYLKGYSEYG